MSTFDEAGRQRKDRAETTGYNEEIVSAGPGMQSVPATGSVEAAESPATAQSPVVAGLEAEADDRARRPIDPQRLVGERAARGSADNPG